MSIRKDPTRCLKWLEETFSTFGTHVTEKVLQVLHAFFDEEDKIAVDEIRMMMRLLGLRLTPRQLRMLTAELDPNGSGHFLLEQTRPIFRFLADNLSSVKEVADSASKTEAMRDGHSAVKEILASIKGAKNRQGFFNFLESLSTDIGQLSDSELIKIFGNK